MNQCEYYHGVLDGCDNHCPRCIGPVLNVSSLGGSFAGVWVQFSVVLPGSNGSIRSFWTIFIIFWYEGNKVSNDPCRSFTFWLIETWTLVTFSSSTFYKMK